MEAVGKAKMITGIFEHSQNFWFYMKSCSWQGNQYIENFMWQQEETLHVCEEVWIPCCHVKILWQADYVNAVANNFIFLLVTETIMAPAQPHTVCCRYRDCEADRGWSAGSHWTIGEDEQNSPKKTKHQTHWLSYRCLQQPQAPS